MLGRFASLPFPGLFFLLSLLVGCATTPPPAPKPAKKPFASCICGPITSVTGKPHCAIWSQATRTDAPQPVLEAEALVSCEAADCSRLFSRSCESIQMAAAVKPSVSAPPAPGQACYCDTVLIENEKSQVRSYCASWVAGATHLIEYYSLNDCSPNRCASPPFYRSQGLCGERFQGFYQALKTKP